MDVTVAVCTFGDPSWERLARERAIPSAQAQVRTIHASGGTLAEARNAGLEQVKSEWICFLDADDELEPGFFDAIEQGTADLRAPAVRYVKSGRAPAAIMPRVFAHQHACTAECLPDGNWMVVGTVAPAQLLRDVGGWREFEWSEDWDLWLRCWKAGASIEAMPAAVYRAHVRADSRNRAPDRHFKLRVHEQIHRANFPELYADAA